jgi:GxxExxY protein
MNTFFLPEPATLPCGLTSRVLGCAIEVHRTLGPGLLESAYRTCLVHELCSAGIAVRHEVPIPILYKERTLDCGFRADLIVDDALLLELKSVERLLPIHEAQILTYLKLTDIRVGFLINFNVTPLKAGIRRFAR